MLFIVTIALSMLMISKELNDSNLYLYHAVHIENLLGIICLRCIFIQFNDSREI